MTNKTNVIIPVQNKSLSYFFEVLGNLGITPVEVEEPEYWLDKLVGDDYKDDGVKESAKAMIREILDRSDSPIKLHYFKVTREEFNLMLLSNDIFFNMGAFDEII